MELGTYILSDHVLSLQVSPWPLTKGIGLAHLTETMMAATATVPNYMVGGGGSVGQVCVPRST